MVRACSILLLFTSTFCFAQKSDVTVSDLLTISTLSPKNVETYLIKRGFARGNSKTEDGIVVNTYLEKKDKNNDAGIADDNGRTIEIYKKGDTRYYLLHTDFENDYKEGRSILKNAGFFYDNDSTQPNGMVFKKGSVVVKAAPVRKNDNKSSYNFLLQKKEFPDPGRIQFAEDLLKFESHEHLVYYFGEENVKKDVYYFSGNESAQCSVLFPNSNQQAVFIWEDEINRYKIAYVLLSGVLKTANTVQFNGNFSQVNWTSKSGVYLGMRLKDLLKLNANDFQFFGRQSDYSFMVVPEKTRYIDFKETAIILDCFDCYNSPLLNTKKVSANAAADEGLSLYVSCIMLKP